MRHKVDSSIWLHETDSYENLLMIAGQYADYQGLVDGTTVERIYDIRRGSELVGVACVIDFEIGPVLWGYRNKEIELGPFAYGRILNKLLKLNEGIGLYWNKDLDHYMNIVTKRLNISFLEEE